MSTPADTPSATGANLLRSLERTGPRPALAWYGEASRIELSGHVLANWVIKSIGHLHDEIALEPGDHLVLDLPPHWKRLALALAAWSLGAEVTVLERGPEADAAEGAAGVESAGASGAAGPHTPDAPRVLVTDRPDTPLAESADEVLALEAVSLAPRYSGELPPLVHDWLSEVRGSSDLLGVALPAWSGPAPEQASAGVPRLQVAGDGLATAPQTLAALLAGGGIVGPASAVTARQAEDEGVTAVL